VLYGLPDVIEAAVVGVPDEKWGEVPAAVVVIAPGGPSPEQIRADCRERLANYKCPRHVLISDEPLPRNAQRKLLKRELRPWAIERITRGSSNN
jgi:fatty-acyl-CoA synthase